MILAQMLYEETGKRSGPAYASDIMKGYEVRSKAADFRAQETIRETTQRINDASKGVNQLKVEFKTLFLHNFKSHRDLTVNFGEMTKITGDNAKGKSSVLKQSHGYCIAWTCWEASQTQHQLTMNTIIH
ncbi:ATP-binding protein [Paenibacillus larvae]|nr:ATP-binding protein [Paenibacillus larvae]MDT2239122.1 ATP-binding protein [Paenibacillus larvae]MDT2257457.1 ATP-binding protein [Paenibacillus larvae]MDT2263940.1 ATP-binding protein [Paenibacillus larvae]MDT2285743.1 ATP-binding protein [Paenibacillus larvae]